MTRVTDSRWRVFQTCFMFASLEHDTPDVLCRNSGYEYSPDCCKINRKEQSKWLPLKNKDIILCALYIMVFIVHKDTVTWWIRWTMKCPPLLYCKSLFVLFWCIENHDEPRRWQRAQYECKRNTFSSTLLCDLICSYIWLKWIVCNLFAMPPWSIVSILCLSFVLHDKMHIDFVLCIPLMGNKRWLFFTICMLKTWLLWIICIHCIGCAAMDDISFWNKTVPPNK